MRPAGQDLAKDGTGIGVGIQIKVVRAAEKRQETYCGCWPPRAIHISDSCCRNTGPPLCKHADARKHESTHAISLLNSFA